MKFCFTISSAQTLIALIFLKMPEKLTGITNFFNTKRKTEMRWCEECRREINLGSGGDSNWKAHLSSSAHLQNLKPEVSSRLTSYFSKAPPRGDNAPPLPAPQQLPSIISYNVDDLTYLDDKEDDKFEVRNSSMGSVSEPANSSQAQSPLSGACNCLTRLKNTISMLPDTLPTADIENPLARYVFPRPMAPDDDPATEIRQHLSWLFTPESTPSDLKRLLARGPHGLDSFLSYLCNCHIKWKTPLNTLDFAINKLISVILQRCVLLLCYTL